MVHFEGLLRLYVISLNNPWDFMVPVFNMQLYTLTLVLSFCKLSDF